MSLSLRLVAVALTLSLAAPLANAGACHDQPNMAAALVALQQAKADLAKAEHNKDGWRDAAIKAVDDAISQVNRGCAFANAH
jgi:hypothetical protein